MSLVANSVKNHGVVLNTNSTVSVNVTTSLTRPHAQSVWRALLLFGLTVLALTVTFWGIHAQDHLFYVWPVTGIALAMILPEWRDPFSRAAQMVAFVLAFVVAVPMTGIPLKMAFFLGLVQAAELCFAAAFLHPTISTFEDLQKGRNVVGFGLMATAAPLLASPLFAIPFSIVMHRDWSTSWRITCPADMVGIAVLTPLVMLLRSQESDSRELSSPEHARGVAVILLCVATTALIFNQTSFPFLFVVFPPLVLTLLTLGFRGAAVVSPLLTLVACVGTACHRGPIMLVHGSSPDSRTIVLQAFLMTIAATAFPVGALLDERKRAEREAYRGQAIYHTLLENSEDMILLSGLEGTSRFVSPGVKHLTGWTADEFLQLPPLETMHPDDRGLAQTIIAGLRSGKNTHHFRYRLKCRTGEYRWVEAVVRGYRGLEMGKVDGYVATVRDISAQKEEEERWTEERSTLSSQNLHLAKLAGHDELTGIANRRTFNSALELEVNRHVRSETWLSLLMIDVDFFKKYNDRYGHPAGDTCLKQLARAMRDASARPTDLAARVGGEEFAVLLPYADAAGAKHIAERIVKLIESLAIPHADNPIERVTVSIGCASWPPRWKAEPSVLMQQADVALYESKYNGRNRISSSSAVPREGDYVAAHADL